MRYVLGFVMLNWPLLIIMATTLPLTIRWILKGERR